MDCRFKKVLVPVSFSARSEKALALGGSLAERDGAELVVLHIIHDAFGAEWSNLPYVYVKQEEWEKHRAEVTEKLKKLIREKVDAGVHVKEFVVDGDPSGRILEIIREEGIDLLVLSHHPGGWVERVLFGHDTNRLAERAPCNVLMVHAAPKAG